MPIPQHETHLIGEDELKDKTTTISETEDPTFEASSSSSGSHPTNQGELNYLV